MKPNLRLVQSKSTRSLKLEILAKTLENTLLQLDKDLPEAEGIVSVLTYNIDYIKTLLDKEG